jgi:hypothetical protein
LSKGELFRWILGVDERYVFDRSSKVLFDGSNESRKLDSVVPGKV